MGYNYCIYCGMPSMAGALICAHCYEFILRDADQKVKKSLLLGLAAIVLSLPAAILIIMQLLDLFFDFSFSIPSIIFRNLSLPLGLGLALGIASIVFSRIGVKKLAALLPAMSQSEIKSLLKASRLGRLMGIMTVVLTFLATAAAFTFLIILILALIEWSKMG